MLSVNSFLEIYELVDEFVSKETETFKFRFLMQSLYDEKFRKDLLQMLKSVQASDTPDAIEEKFVHMRNLCVKELKKAENAAKEEKRMDYMLRALAYFCLLETFNENSSFSEKIEKMIIYGFGDDYLEQLKVLDREFLSKDVKQKNLVNKDSELEQEDILDSDIARKYLIMKKWQDEQRSFSLKYIRTFYPIEKRYIGEDVNNLMELHRKTLVKRAMDQLSNMELIPLDLLSCYYIVGLEKELISVVGGKALGLAILNSKGFQVPQTWVIPIGIYIKEEMFIKLDRKKAYAVRSSANCEDSTILSFAGVFNSYLDVEFKDLAKKVMDVRGSIDNERAKKYLELHSVKVDPQMAVVIQNYIEPDKAGVWLGTQIDEGVLEWCFGNGEKLVSGEITPKIEKWKCDKRTDGNGQEVSYDLVKNILTFQEKVGKIADVEWCIKNDQIYMLQYRPITAKIPLEDIVLNKEEHSIIKGIPVSGGYVKGNAKFLGRDFQNADWNSGDILLAWFTDPDWLDILQKASGLVTAVGGMLCHAAIIARELEIPCVTGIGGENMKQIWGGGQIEIDGYKGIVRILKEK